MNPALRGSKYPIEVQIPILIVGAGPTGLLQARLLSRLGIRSLVIERYPQRLGAPKAHALSPRSLEICRQFELDVNRIRSLGTKREDSYFVNFIANLSGERVGVLAYERMDAEVLDVTPEMIHNIPQPDFERFLMESLEFDPNVEIRKGVSFVSLTQDERLGKVSTIVEEVKVGRRYCILSRHVVACDGARSAVRSFLNIESEDEETYETMMTIHINADLRPIVQERVGMLHWILDPEVSGFIIGYNLSSNQVLICSIDEASSPVASWTVDHCRKIVDRAIGRVIPYDILSHRPWTFGRKLAKKYRLDNVFLAGDAAHAFPPTGGLGLNSGIGDVHNLAYKLAGVHQGWANDSILDSYYEERQMVANINSIQSIKNGKQIFALLKALGASGFDDPEEARKALYQNIHDPSKEEEIQKQILAQTEHFDNLELHIGYVYGSKTIPPNASDYKPKYIPGARLPHAWIAFPKSTTVFHPAPVDASYVKELSVADLMARRFSTLDLVSPRRFTVIAGVKRDWQRKIISVRNCMNEKLPPIDVVGLGEDFEVIKTPTGDAWLRETKLHSGYALLVRPDQHILSILEPNSTGNSIAEVLQAHLRW